MGKLLEELAAKTRPKLTISAVNYLLEGYRTAVAQQQNFEESFPNTEPPHFVDLTYRVYDGVEVSWPHFSIPEEAYPKVCEAVREVLRQRVIDAEEALRQAGIEP